MKSGLRVYVAGPMTKGSMASNIRIAFECANTLMKFGHFPFLPQVYFYMDVYYPQDYEKWMEFDFVYLEICHALVRIPGESVGADREIEFAKSRGIPVFHDLADFWEWTQL